MRAPIRIRIVAIAIRDFTYDACYDTLVILRFKQGTQCPASKKRNHKNYQQQRKIEAEKRLVSESIMFSLFFMIELKVLIFNFP